MKKLKSTDGKTMLMALLLVLSALAAGAAVLTAATSAARHVENDRQARQDYLTVSSAATLIRDEILSASYQRTFDAIHTFGTGADAGTETVTYKTTIQEPEGLLGPWLEDCVDDGDGSSMYAGLAAAAGTITVDVAVDRTTALRTVEAVFSAKDDGSIQVLLSLKQEAGETTDCRMTLTLQAEVTPEQKTLSGNGADYTDRYTTVITWNSPRITKGFREDGP